MGVFYFDKIIRWGNTYDLSSFFIVKFILLICLVALSPSTPPACIYFKHGGLDSRDQLRSRSRMSFVSRLTFENRRECPSCRHQLFFFLVEIFKIETFQSRLGCVKINIETVEIFEICQDFQDLLSLFEIYRDISILSRLFEVLLHQKSCQIEKSRSRIRIKLTNSWSRSRKTVEICQKFHVIETFETGRWCRDKIEISRSSRLTFWNCRDFLDCWDQPFSSVEIGSLNRDHVETNRDPLA